MLLKSKYQNKYLFDLHDFEIVGKIDSGGYGFVYSIQNVKTNEKYAAKIIKNWTDPYTKQLINREILIMMHTKHPTIITFHGYSLTDIEGHDNITIIMKLAQKGSLFDLLQNVRKGLAGPQYDNTAKQKILIGISRGMMYLHKNNIIHRDLKPGNIVFDKEFCPLITDFGLSKYIKKDDSLYITKYIGTPTYMAPEVKKGKRYGMKADVYSFAIIMYEIVTDLLPYPLNNNKIVNDNYRPEFKVPIKKSFKELIEKCWSNDPNQRPSFDQIFIKLSSMNDPENDCCLDYVDVDYILDYIEEITSEEVDDKSSLFSKSEYEQMKNVKQNERSKASNLSINKNESVNKESHFSVKNKNASVIRNSNKSRNLIVSKNKENVSEKNKSSLNSKNDSNKSRKKSLIKQVFI